LIVLKLKFEFKEYGPGLVIAFIVLVFKEQ